MKYYQISERELRTVSHLNATATALITLGSALVSFAFGLWSNLFVAKDAPPDVMRIGIPMTALLTAGGLSVLIGAGLSIWNRRGLIDQIIREHSFSEVER